MHKPLMILKVGDTFPDVARVQGDFEDWVAQGLGDLPLPLEVIDPRRHTLPSISALAGVVITGSHAMVSDREPWSEACAAWLRELVQRGTPVLGVCYGHQLLAHALGGEVGYHPDGMEIGSVQVRLKPEAADDPLLKVLPGEFPAQVVHSQSVLRLPAGARHLAASAFEPVQAFRYGATAWGVQFHPEFSAQAMRGYIDALDEPLRSKGREPDALRRAVVDTPESASLLGRFARIVAAQQGLA